MSETITTEYRPDYVSPPGDTLLEMLESIGMTQAELAERTGRPKKTINEIIKGKAAITPETALQLEKVLSVSASFWNNRERNYREAMARRNEREHLEASVSWLKEFPVKAMVKWGWIQAKGDPVDQLDELLKFFAISTPKSLEHLREDVCFRRSSAYKADLGACVAWLRKGIIDGQRVACRPYDSSTFKTALIKARHLTVQTPEKFVPELISLSANSGVAVVFVPELPRIGMYEATRWLTQDKALIQLCLRYKTDDQLWFSFFHGAGHVYLHNKRNVFIENGKEKAEAEQEREADEFARDLLISPSAYGRFVGMNDFRKETIKRFAVTQHIAPGIVVGRLQHEKQIPYNYAHDLKRRLAWQ
jgi:HTH-type transcriptional regulator / antitoxin HigA